MLLLSLIHICGKDKAATEHVVEKPKVKVADVKARPVDQIQEYTATVAAEAQNNIAPSSPVRIDQIFVEVGDRVSRGQRYLRTVQFEHCTPVSYTHLDVYKRQDVCNEYSFIEVYESIMFTYIRGISTEKGAKVLEDFISEYRRNRIE